MWQTHTHTHAEHDRRRSTRYLLRSLSDGESNNKQTNNTETSEQRTQHRYWLGYTTETVSIRSHLNS